MIFGFSITSTVIVVFTLSLVFNHWTPRVSSPPRTGEGGGAMEFLQPATWAEALQIKAAHPPAVPIQGGTDVMVEISVVR